MNNIQGSRHGLAEAADSSYGDDATRTMASQVDLKELIEVVWRGKWFILIFVLVSAVASFFYATSLPNIYRSTTLLAPSEESQGGGISRMAGQLGGLASLAGMNFAAGAGDNKVAVAIAVLTSRQFLINFVEKHNIMADLMAVDRWDPLSNSIIYDPDIYDQSSGTWVRKVVPPRTARPTSWESYHAISSLITINHDKSTGFVTVGVEHQSPVLAAQWAKSLIQDVNLVMRKKDVTEAQRSINYLSGQLASVALAEMRNVFYQLIEEQTKTIMLAEVREEYVFRTIDPPVIPEDKIRPARSLICAMAVVLGGALAVMLVLLNFFIRRVVSAVQG